MKNRMRVIAVLEIIGGVAGVGFVLLWLLTNPVNIVAALLTLLTLGIYLLSLAAGVTLWRGSPFGRTASIIVQAIQLPKIISQPIIFSFSFGFDFWVYFGQAGASWTLGLNFNLPASNQLFFNVQGAPFGLGISLSAFIFLMMLLDNKPNDPLTQTVSPPPPPPPPDWGDPIG